MRRDEVDLVGRAAQLLVEAVLLVWETSDQNPDPSRGFGARLPVGGPTTARVDRDTTGADMDTKRSTASTAGTAHRLHRLLRRHRRHRLHRRHRRHRHRHRALIGRVRGRRP